MIVGIPRETFHGERRVAIVPASVSVLTKAGLDVMVETAPVNRRGAPTRRTKRRVPGSPATAPRCSRRPGSCSKFGWPVPRARSESPT